jgi:CheY-like chemotaxis protein
MRARILVVEDGPQIRELTAEILGLADFDVTSVSNGQEALDALAQETPAAMLLDLQLPVLDGREVVRRLQAQGRHIPTVVITGRADPRQCCAEVGAESCLAKPFDLESLLAEVVRVRSHDPQNP